MCPTRPQRRTFQFMLAMPPVLPESATMSIKLVRMNILDEMLPLQFIAKEESECWFLPCFGRWDLLPYIMLALFHQVH